MGTHQSNRGISLAQILSVGFRPLPQTPPTCRRAGTLVPEIRARDLARHVDRHRMAKTVCGLGERSDSSHGAAQAAGAGWL